MKRAPRTYEYLLRLLLTAGLSLTEAVAIAREMTTDAAAVRKVA